MPRNRPSWRRRLETALLRGLVSCGALRFHGLLHPAGGATILMYHSVSGRELAPWIDPGNAEDPTQFAAQMEFLAAHRRVVSLDALVADLECGHTPRAGTVALTFDDGYLDNYTVAAPILRRLGLPATFFLATGYVDGGRPQWVDDLYAQYRHRTANRLHVFERRFDLHDPRAVDESYTLLHDALLAADMEVRDHILSAVREQLQPAGAQPKTTMTWADVRALAASSPRFHIGVHTRGHVALPDCSRASIEQELHACVGDVARRVGIEPRFFSYPYGRSSGVARELVATTFRAAVVTTPAALVNARSDRFALPRVPPAADARAFAFCTSGADPNLVRKLLKDA